MGQPSTIPFPKGNPKASRNGRGSQSKAAHRPYSEDADARYAAALKLVQAIDHNLRNGTHHYYDTQGRLLSTLDEVIHAVLNDNLAVGKPVAYPQGERSAEWVSVSELVA
jgi:hypothetical protein